MALVRFRDCPFGFRCWLPYMDVVAAVSTGQLASCVGRPVKSITLCSMPVKLLWDCLLHCMAAGLLPVVLG